jgi:hypothetical protein
MIVAAEEMLQYLSLAFSTALNYDGNISKIKDHCFQFFSFRL